MSIVAKRSPISATAEHLYDFFWSVVVDPLTYLKFGFKLCLKQKLGIIFGFKLSLKLTCVVILLLRINWVSVWN